MPIFTFYFVNEKTKRQNKREREAFDESELREILLKEGIKPIEIVREPDKEATSAQIDYLRNLGFRVRERLTLAEASAIIDNIKSKREPAEPRVFSIASSFRVETTRFDSKAAIYEKILNKVMCSADIELAVWFTFRVYRAEFNKGSLNGIDDPRNENFVDIANELLLDEKALHSLRKSSENSVTAFRWFGTWLSPDKIVHTGDSRRTAAYEFVRKALERRGFERPPTTTATATATRTAIKQKDYDSEYIARNNPKEFSHREEYTPNHKRKFLFAIIIIFIIYILFK